MARDRAAIALGVLAAAVAVVLVLVFFPDRLQSCGVRPIDGIGSTPCDDRYHWTTEAIMGTVIAVVFGVMALTALGLGLRPKQRR